MTEGSEYTIYTKKGIYHISVLNLQYKDGLEYFNDEVLHREDGPAVERANGDK